ncbi:hypothetical protein PLA107_030440 (plasmid) [Pseudomonas amygdali pv. lachrymans str. M301315]|uniref:Uncharacterized protein n=1 Tax=Pseudomonas amygdali pv. lachrymans str. M301315 TaxID=629260 RepID=A0AAD0PVE5_PSEAV|nr:hypothetical protein PLA107_030440 [Pseudomonas amygdali pv. lachrymans str. M301315]
MTILVLGIWRSRYGQLASYSMTSADVEMAQLVHDALNALWIQDALVAQEFFQLVPVVRFKIVIGVIDRHRVKLNFSLHMHLVNI